MNEEEFTDDILDTITRLNKMSKGQAGSMFAHGDIDNMKSFVTIKGDIRALAISICNQMAKEPQVNNFMKSLMSSYLRNNPKEIDDFVRSLKMPLIQTNTTLYGMQK